MGEFLSRNMLGLIKKTNKRKRCCILLVVYIGALKELCETTVSFVMKLVGSFTLLSWVIKLAMN
jgi:hypothetical protein